jgi:hypothetical protein
VGELPRRKQSLIAICEDAGLLTKAQLNKLKVRELRQVLIEHYGIQQTTLGDDVEVIEAVAREAPHQLNAPPREANASPRELNVPHDERESNAGGEHDGDGEEDEFEEKFPPKPDNNDEVISPPRIKRSKRNRSKRTPESRIAASKKKRSVD